MAKIRNLLGALLILASSNVNPIQNDYLEQKILEYSSNKQSFIVVKKSDYKLDFYDYGKLTKSYPVSLGKYGDLADKQEAGDYRTPEGILKIEDKAIGSTYRKCRNGKGIEKNPYGTRWMRLYSDKGWKGLGIHGSSVAVRECKSSTLGCVALDNKDIEEFYDRAYVGMKVIIEH